MSEFLADRADAEREGWWVELEWLVADEGL